MHCTEWLQLLAVMFRGQSLFVCSIDYLAFFGKDPLQITFICSVNMGTLNCINFFLGGSLKLSMLLSFSQHLQSQHQGSPKQNGLEHIQQTWGLKTVLYTDWLARVLPWQYHYLNELQIGQPMASGALLEKHRWWIDHLRYFLCPHGGYGLTYLCSLFVYYLVTHVPS